MSMLHVWKQTRVSWSLPHSLLHFKDNELPTMFRLTCSLHVHGNSRASREKQSVFRSPEREEKIVVQDSDSVVLRFYGTLRCFYSSRFLIFIREEWPTIQLLLCHLHEKFFR